MPVPEPRIARSLTLHFYGDWGQANLHRVFCWLSQEMVDRTGFHSRFAIWNGRGVADAVRMVGRGLMDVALAVPVAGRHGGARRPPRRHSRSTCTE